MTVAVVPVNPLMMGQKTLARCLFCDSRDLSESFFPPTRYQNKTFCYVKCDHCGLHFLSDPLTQEDLEALYSPSYHHSYDEKTDHYDQIFEWIRGSGKTLLDYGCGCGDFLREAKTRGYDGVGVEFHADFVKELKSRWPGTSFLTAEEFVQSNNKFDVIRMGDVLEHSREPKALLASLKARLKPRGILCVQGPLEINPSLAFYLRRIYFAVAWNKKRHRFASHPPYHVFFSHAKNQKSFLEKQGFKTLGFQVNEEAWPYVGKWEEVKRAADAAKFLVARTSMAVSSFIPALGNRFTYVGSIAP